jgi:diguanylate cyclase (GGDEF)-like protein
MVRTFTDVTERRRAEARIAELATHDDLTGLSNRSRFREQMNQAINSAERYGESFALLMLDLDGFKQINDSMGHPAGDAVLKEISRRLLVCARNTDTVARLGGDEFAVLQSKIRTDEDAAIFARRLINAIRAPFDLDGKIIIPATSIGIAIALRDGADCEQLIKASDQALYRAKEFGSNTFCFSKSAAVPAQAGEVVELTRAAS